MGKKIIINQGDEYKEKLETDIQKDCFFYEAYNSANTILYNILRDMDINNKLVDKHRKCGNRHSINNIITFNADRGHGKTSAMISFANYLANKNHLGSSMFDENFDYSFKLLPVIDPSELNSGESILRIFLARLFKEYQDIKNALFENNVTENIQSARIKHQEILELFQKCYKLRCKTHRLACGMKAAFSM